MGGQLDVIISSYSKPKRKTFKSIACFATVAKTFIASAPLLFEMSAEGYMGTFWFWLQARIY